jgi:phospholipid/cholesterol/gamma-HCH transport system ATP-binding protein
MIELVNVKKQFSPTGRFVTDGVTFFLPKGKSLCIIGASGEGKSVLLKQIIGLIKSSSGKIIIDGVDIMSLNEKELDQVFKKCGYVFQFAALLDSLTIYENVAITLIEQGESEEKITPLVKSVLEQVNLSFDIAHRYPSEISGGMRKRVGLARTLITDPSIILYDEPTSGLDPVTTRIIHELMHQTHTKRDITSIVISHDVEIFKYVDLVGFLYKGKIEFLGPAKDIWESQDPFIYQFIRGLIKGPILGGD